MNTTYELCDWFRTIGSFAQPIPHSIEIQRQQFLIVLIHHRIKGANLLDNRIELFSFALMIGDEEAEKS